MNPVSLVQHLANFPEYLIEPALRSLIVACAAGIVIATLARKRAALRLYLWTAVLYVALAMPLLGAFLPAMKVAIPASRFIPTSWAATSPEPSAAPQPSASAVDTGSSVKATANNKVAADKNNAQRHLFP